MSINHRQVLLRTIPAIVAAILFVLLTTRAAVGEDTAKLRGDSGRRPVLLWPLDVEPAQPGIKGPLELGGWTYEARRASSPRGGVPWELRVTPGQEMAGAWKAGSVGRLLPTIVAERNRTGEPTKDPDAMPVIEMPDGLWKTWMAADLQDVVGIHFHVFHTDDTARILFTLHKEPPDDADAATPRTSEDDPIEGTRIEATLLAPVSFGLDQTLMVRDDPLEKQLAASRGQHELSHAEVSQQVMIAVLRGPQDWDPARCTGRRSEIEYFWKREQIGRSWEGYRGGVSKVLALRTTVVLVPPTRWSMLVPLPPERITQKHLEQFNDAVVMVGQQFTAIDRAAQDRFHAEHGAYEASAGP